MVAGADGEVRFYPPPQSWGAKLVVTCTLNGVAQGSHSIDLTDASTFKREPDSTLVPHITGRRPALTGDPTSISIPDLVSQGYPPRPDPKMDQTKYSKWLAEVSHPVDLYSVILTAGLGESFTGVNQGAGSNNAWSGFVQTTDGWAFPALQTSSASTLYMFYYAQMNVPSGVCPSGNCFTGIWAGVGGVPTSFFGGAIGSSLIQNGFAMLTSGTAKLFAEYFPQLPLFPSVPGGATYAANDSFEFWGYSATSSACTFPPVGTLGGAVACFQFYDVTNNWEFSSPIFQAAKSGSTYIPTTVEYVAELGTKAGAQNEEYFFPSMVGLGYDSNGNYHVDPGNSGGTDPYIVLTQPGTAGPVSQAIWNNGTQITAQDPIYFSWLALN